MEYATVVELMREETKRINLHPEALLAADLNFYKIKDHANTKNDMGEIAKPLWQVAPYFDTFADEMDDGYFTFTIHQDPESVARAIQQAFIQCRTMGIQMKAWVYGDDGINMNEGITIQQEEYNLKYSFVEGYDDL